VELKRRKIFTHLWGVSTRSPADKVLAWMSHTQGKWECECHHKKHNYGHLC